VAQLLRPIADTLTTGWLTHTGASTNLWATLDEEPPDDTDFATQQNGSNNNPLEVRFAAPSDPPILRRGHILAYRYRKHQALGNVRNVQMELRQNSTIIATGTLHTDISVAWLPGAFTLTRAQAATITDYANLRARAVPTGAINGTTARRQVQVSHAVLRLPDATDILDDWRTRWGVPVEITTLEALIAWLEPQAATGDVTWGRRYRLAIAVWKVNAYRPMLASINAGTYTLPPHQTQQFAASKITGKLGRFQAIADTLDAEDGA
jgi:hypothetical protein